MISPEGSKTAKLRPNFNTRVMVSTSGSPFVGEEFVAVFIVDTGLFFCKGGVVTLQDLTINPKVVLSHFGNRESLIAALPAKRTVQLLNLCDSVQSFVHIVYNKSCN